MNSLSQHRTDFCRGFLLYVSVASLLVACGGNGGGDSGTTAGTSNVSSGEADSGSSTGSSVGITGTARYVATTGTDTGECLNSAAPCRTIAYGVSQLAAGETLVVGNGTYHEDQVARYAPSGNAGADGVPGTADDVYTAIQAETDFGVVLVPRTGVPHNGTIYLYAKSYIKVRGFIARGNAETGPLGVIGSDHIKIIRCGFTHAATDGNPANASVGPASDYVLIEESYAFGGGRYQFLVYQSDHTVVRRCVARNDYFTGATSGLQSAAFTNYDSVNTAWQNNIAIDSDTNDCCTGHNGLYAAFFNENKTDYADDTSEEFRGNIVLNYKPVYAANMDGVASGTHTLSDNIYWDTLGGYSAGQGSGTLATVRISNMTVGLMSSTYNHPNNGGAAWGTGVSISDNINNLVSNSIFVANHSYGVADYARGDYNAFFGNGANYGGTYTPNPGAHDLSSHNILYKANTNPGGSLRYLPRGPETGSVLATAGEAGARVGAEVMWKIGVDGALWGESGWNTVRSANSGFGGASDRLWPFPNEAVIKADMRTYSGPGPAGARGFCAAGKQLNGVGDITLTSYIWEYLGNPMPASFY